MSTWPSPPPIDLDFIEPHPPERVWTHRAIVLNVGRNGLDCDLYAQNHEGRVLLQHTLFYQTIPAPNTQAACHAFAVTLAKMLGVPLIVESS